MRKGPILVVLFAARGLASGLWLALMAHLCASLFGDLYALHEQQTISLFSIYARVCAITTLVGLMLGAATQHKSM